MRDNLGLYIHIPFCNSKCPYCDFFSGKGCESDYDFYTNQLIEKIKHWSIKTDKQLTSIYFGGGTPSVLGTDRLCKILESTTKSFRIADNSEITLEINPESGKNLYFVKLYNAGFNRLSMGMQSAVEKELRALGRIHSKDDVMLTIEKASAAGFNNISLDLMMGIPHQSIESLKQSIDFCNECGVSHISSYLLKLEQGTKFYARRKDLILPSDDEQADFYLFAVNYLDKLGYKQYEISNFAKQDCESRHNINYWKCGEYIGIGPSAHSFFNGERFFYNRNMKDFIENKTVFDCIGGTKDEFVMLSLRLKDGLSFEEYENRFGIPFPTFAKNKIKTYSAHGLMEINNKKTSFTPKGWLVSNAILSEIIDCI